MIFQSSHLLWSPNSVIQETVNLGELIDQSIEARRNSQRAGIEAHIEQLPIFGIHKDIFLAFRYRRDDKV
jgi:hypothetical protein